MMKKIVALLCAVIMLLCVSSCGTEGLGETEGIKENGKKVVLIPQNFYDFFKVDVSSIKSSKKLTGSEVVGKAVISNYERTTIVSYTIKPLIPLQISQDITVFFSIGSSDSPDHFRTSTSKCVIDETGRGNGQKTFFDNYSESVIVGSYSIISGNSFGDAVFNIESIDGYVLIDPEIYDSLLMKK